METSVSQTVKTVVMPNHEIGLLDSDVAEVFGMDKWELNRRFLKRCCYRDDLFYFPTPDEFEYLKCQITSSNHKINERPLVYFETACYVLIILCADKLKYPLLDKISSFIHSQFPCKGN